MSASRHVTITGLLLVAGLPSTASLASVVTSRGVPRLGVVPSLDDVPPGNYSWGSVPSELAGKLESAEMTVTYGLNSAAAHFYFLGTSNKKRKRFHSVFYELRAESYKKRISRYGIGRCYYFALNVAKKLRRLLLLESGLIGEHVLLCTKETSTSPGNRELTLYWDAVRGVRKKYDQLNMPVDLNFTGGQKTTGASATPRGPHESDDGSPKKAVETFPSRCKSMKDGNYLNLSAVLNLETRHDGRQRAMLTSHDGNERFSTLENVLVVPAEDYLTTGCCELENTGIFICPTGADDLLLRAPGVELELVYADVHALEAQLS